MYALQDPLLRIMTLLVRFQFSGAVSRVEDVEKLEKSPLIAKNIPIYGVIYHTEVRHICSCLMRKNKA